MFVDNELDDNVECLSDTHGVSRECAKAYPELEEWAQTHNLPMTVLYKFIEAAATLFGWSEEATAKEWTFSLTVEQILDLCDQYASGCRTARCSMILRDLLDGSDGNISVMALATVIDACGAKLTVSMVKALVKPHVTR